MDDVGGGAVWVVLLVSLAACGGVTDDGRANNSLGGMTGAPPSHGSGGAVGAGGNGGNTENGGSSTGGTSSGGSFADAGVFVVQGPPAECSEPKELGPCDAAMARYYFDTIAGRCQPFTYGGCQGNSNNFDTLAACEQRCIGSGCRCNANGCSATSSCPQCPGDPSALTAPCYVTMACTGGAADCRCEVPSEGVPGKWYCSNDGR